MGIVVDRDGHIKVTRRRLQREWLVLPDKGKFNKHDDINDEVRSSGCVVVDAMFGCDLRNTNFENFEISEN
jgi:hypothetical protein